MATATEQPATEQQTTPAQRLQTTMAAVRVSISWFGVRKSLSAEQKSQAAESFGAEGRFLSAGKKLIDTTHPAFKTLTGVRNRTSAYWKGMSLPYPEPGIRLVRQDDIDAFNLQMETFSAELDEAVDNLQRHYADLVDSARRRLGSLFNAADYPETLQGLFTITWDFPSVEPPAYLRQLNPDLYQQECQRVAARFDEAVQLAEEAFISEMAKVVSHLTERLSGQSDGRPKIFRDSAVGNLTDFFRRFKALNVGSNAELDRLVERAQQIVQNVEPQDLRDNTALRQHVATELAAVQSVFDGLMVDRPRRNILRRPK